MKKNIINCLLLATLLFVGCKKNDARYPFTVALSRVPYVNAIVDPTSSAAIDVLNLGVFSGKFNITLLYPTDVPPSKVDIVIIKNGVNSSVKVVQAGVTTFPTATITITAAQIATLFGATIVLGDNYDIGTDIYTADGTKYPAFPFSGPTAAGNLLAYSGTGQANQPGFVPTIRFGAICAYDPLIYQGNFIVTRDDWQDTNPGDIIVLTKIDATHFSYIYPTAVNPIPIIVTVNTLNNVTSITKQTIGSAWNYGPAYTIPFAATAASALNFVAPCSKTLSLNMQYGYSAGTFSGLYPFQLIKQ